MSPIDQLADDRDMLKSKLRQANAKLRQAKDQLGAIKTRRLELMHALYRADAANVRARAMLCDAAGIPHDADILEWIAGAKARIASLEEAGDELRVVCESVVSPSDVAKYVKRWTAAKETKP